MVPISLALANLAHLAPTGLLSVDLLGALATGVRAVPIAAGLAIAVTLLGLAARPAGSRGRAPRNLRAPRLHDVAPLPPAA